MDSGCILEAKKTVQVGIKNIRSSKKLRSRVLNTADNSRKGGKVVSYWHQPTSMYSNAVHLAVLASVVYVAVVESRTCHKEGEKCKGAEGYPAVPWLGCCKGYECEGRAADWGYTCVKRNQYPASEPPKKCHKPGEKCIGAEGHPAVPWLGCCDDYVCEGKASDWGYVCVKKESPKCHKVGEKCMGAPGYPAVPWLGCCDGMTCTGKAYDWGMMCEKPGKTTSAPSTTTAAKCAKEGDRCNGSYPPCCGSSPCLGESGFETCQVSGSNEFPSCVTWIGRCGAGINRCCGDLTCDWRTGDQICNLRPGSPPRRP